MGLNLHENLGIDTIQGKPLEMSAIEFVEEIDPTSQFWRDSFVKRYPKVFSGLVRSKNHKTFTNFKDPLIPRHVKGSKVRIHIQDRVATEIKALIRDIYIERLDNCTTAHFNAPMFLTAKKDELVKLALNAKPMKAQIWKNKHQMPNMHERIYSAAQIIIRNTHGLPLFT